MKSATSWFLIISMLSRIGQVYMDDNLLIRLTSSINLFAALIKIANYYFRSQFQQRYIRSVY